MHRIRLCRRFCEELSPTEYFANWVLASLGAVLASKLPNLIYVVDRDEHRIAAWNSEDLPLPEPGLDEIIKARRNIGNRTDAHTTHTLNDAADIQAEDGHNELVECFQVYGDHNLVFTTDIPEAIRKADLIFICVNTPSKPSEESESVGLDMQNIEFTVDAIAEHSTCDKIIVVKSTVPCGTNSLIQNSVPQTSISSYQVVLIVD